MRQIAEESSKNKKEFDDIESKYNQQEIDIIDKNKKILDLQTKCNI